MCVRSAAQSCLTLYDSMDCSPPSSSIHGILQARILKSIALFSSRGSSQPRDQTHVSCSSCLSRWVSLPLSHLGNPENHGVTHFLLHVICGTHLEMLKIALQHIICPLLHLLKCDGGWVNGIAGLGGWGLMANLVSTFLVFQFCLVLCRHSLWVRGLVK